MEKMTNHYKNSMNTAIITAQQFNGNTAPNPPVGAVVLDINGQIISTGAHEKAGLPHAEVIALENARKNGNLNKAHSLVVTLEPCCHTEKKTPPCAQYIAELPIQNIVIGTLDPNPLVCGKGVELLKKAGKNIILNIEKENCLDLIKGYSSQTLRNKPWFIIKKAVNEKGDMIPPAGQKTFTSHESLIFAHQLRKKSDAILTGIGTVLADQPLFTVRHIPDFSDKKRILAICEGKRKTPKTYIESIENDGFIVIRDNNIQNLIERLSEKNILQVLIEAGPKLISSIYKLNLWDEEVEITKKYHQGEPDLITIKKRAS